MTVEFLGKIARDYQANAPVLTLEALQDNHSRICLISPTGSGKTTIAGLLATDPAIREHLGIVDRPTRILFACHRHKLLTQNAQELGEHPLIEVIPHMISAGSAHNIDALLATEFDLVINDECHHEATVSFQMQLEALTKAPIIGLTATEERPDKKLLKFSKFIELLDRETAVEQGYLAETELHSFVVPGESCRVEAGAEILGLMKDEIGQTMAFVRKKTDAHKFMQLLEEAGVSARASVDISEQELDAHLDDFAAGEYQVNVSCMKLGEGIDVRGCQTTALVRNCNVKGLMNQMIGRSSRPDCDNLVIEMVDPLAKNEITAKDVVKNPKAHFIWFKQNGKWIKSQLA